MVGRATRLYRAGDRLHRSNWIGEEQPTPETAVVSPQFRLARLLFPPFFATSLLRSGSAGW